MTEEELIYTPHMTFGERQASPEVWTEVDELRKALAESADLTHRRQLPLTAQIHDIATAALYGKSSA